jgi:hypothetical protein
MALMLEENDTNTLANASLSLRLGANRHNSPHGLMRRYDWTRGVIYTLKHLVVGVTETSRSNLDEEIVVPDFRHRDLAYLIRSFVLNNFG